MIRSIAIALVASLIAMSPAHAGNTETFTRRVKIADLDLASAAGRSMLELRIRTASRSVCRDAGSIGGYHTLGAEGKCIEQAIADTRPRVALLLAAASTGIAMMNARPNQ